MSSAGVVAAVMATELSNIVLLITLYPLTLVAKEVRDLL